LGTTTQLRDLERASASRDQPTATEDVKTLVEQTMTAAQTVDERGQLALQLICDAVEASSGHLYLTTGDALTLAASYRTAPANSGLTARISTFYNALRDRSEAAAPAEPQQVPTQLEYEDQLYQLLVLRVEGDRGLDIAGLAAIITTSAPRVSELAAVLGALAAHVIRMKPATGAV
jgi:hypothetical protein